MNSYIAKYLAAVGEQDMAKEVEQMCNRLDAFAEGLDVAALDCAIKAAEEAVAEVERLNATIAAQDAKVKELERKVEFWRDRSKGQDAQIAAQAEQIRVARKAMAEVIAWDKRRNFMLPYKVRDPIHAALAKIGGAS